MRLLNFLKLENRTAAGADPEIGHGGWIFVDFFAWKKHIIVHTENTKKKKRNQFLDS